MYDPTEERLLVKGSERITRDLHVKKDIETEGNIIQQYDKTVGPIYKALLPIIESESVSIHNKDVAPMAQGSSSGLVSYDPTNNELVTGNNVNGDLRVTGDLIVNGTTHTVDVEEVAATGDIITLRANNSNTLSSDQISGLVVNKYDGIKDLAVGTSSDGTLRVGTAAGTDVSYTNIALKHEDGLYYSYDNLLPPNYTLLNPQPLGTMSSWTGKAEVEGYTKYASAVFTQVDITTMQPVLTRAESSSMSNKGALIWDSANNRAVSSTTPTVSQFLGTDANGNVTWINQSSLTPGRVAEADHALTADTATTANRALLANTAGTADSAGSADLAHLAERAYEADHAASADMVSKVLPSGLADYNLLYSQIADNDYFRLRVGGGSNAGWAALETADDGTEPISVAQYTGVFSTEVRRAYLLDGNGNTSFPGTVTAAAFSGNLSGTASSANTADKSAHLLISGSTWESNWYWNGQSGQPTWLWGSNDGIGMYVWNPSNFSVKYASSAGSADTATTAYKIRVGAPAAFTPGEIWIA